MEEEDYFDMDEKNVSDMMPAEFRVLLTRIAPLAAKHYPRVLDAHAEAVDRLYRTAKTPSSTGRVVAHERALILSQVARFENDCFRTFGVPQPAQPPPRTEERSSAADGLIKEFAFELGLLPAHELEEKFRVAAIADANAIMLEGPSAMIRYLAGRL